MRAKRWLTRIAVVMLALVLVMEVFAGEALARPRRGRHHAYRSYRHRSRHVRYVPRVVTVPRVTYYYPSVYYYPTYDPCYYGGVTYHYTPTYRSSGGIYIRFQW